MSSRSVVDGHPSRQGELDARRVATEVGSLTPRDRKVSRSIREHGVDATAWDDRYAAEELVWSRGPNVFVADELADLPPGRALDLAGGEGRNAIWLAERGWEVELVEFSQVALDKAAELASHAGVTLTPTLADVTDPVDTVPADLVVQTYLQLPREPSRRATRVAASLVAPGGTLLVVAHARRNLEDGTGGPPDPEVLRTPTDVVEDLAGTGLRVVDAGEVTRSVTTDDGERHAVDLLVRAERPLDVTSSRGTGAS